MRATAIARQVAAERGYIAAVAALVRMQNQPRADARAIAAARPAQVNFQGGAGAEPVLEEFGRAEQVVDHDIEIAVIVQVGQAHAAAACLVIQPPARLRREARARQVAINLVLFDQLISTRR